MNDHQKNRFGKVVLDSMFNTVNNKRIAVLGFAFKADTGDTRESPAIDICGTLLGENAQVCIYDPQVKEAQVRRDLAKFGKDEKLSIATDAYTACEGAHAAVIITEWKEFKTLDLQKIYDLMSKPAFMFDGRNILDHDTVQRIGFRLRAIGKPKTWSWRQDVY